MHKRWNHSSPIVREVSSKITPIGIREEAAKALGKIGDVRAVKPLIAALLTDDESSVHRAAAQALGKIGDVQAVEPLITALKNVSDAASALGELKDARAVEPLIAVLRINVGVVEKLLRH